jgi:GNAT superfamily N-acetyltransferase
MTSPFMRVKRGTSYTYKTTTPMLQPIRHGNEIVFRDLNKSFDEVDHVYINALPKDKEFNIEYFEVDERFRGMGYRQEMYEWMEEYAIRRSMKQIIFYPKESVVGFWRKMGFKWPSMLMFKRVKVLR